MLNRCHGLCELASSKKFIGNSHRRPCHVHFWCAGGAGCQHLLQGMSRCCCAGSSCHGLSNLESVSKLGGIAFSSRLAAIPNLCSITWCCESDSACFNMLDCAIGMKGLRKLQARKYEQVISRHKYPEAFAAQTDRMAILTAKRSWRCISVFV